MNFEILREMETFTEKMFNGIIGFQEKDHPAWDESLNFEQRIKNLPLHYLVFSNADRDPEKFGPTIAHYYPLYREMKKLAAYIRQISADPKILDVHGRNGFIGSLLANQGFQITGLRDPNEKPNQITNFFDANCYQLIDGTLKDSDISADIIFSSWMPSNTDITAEIISANPKLVIYIFTEHVNEFSKHRQTGMDNAFGEQLPQQYTKIDEWKITRPMDLFHDIWPDITSNIKEERIVRVFANQEFCSNVTSIDTHSDKKYDWENELIMAETAHAAKAQMKQRGFPVDV